MSSASGEDLSQFVKWYHQARTPKLKVDESYKDFKYTLTLTQIVPKAVDDSGQEPYFFPLKLALLDENGNEMKLVSVGQERLKDGILIVSKDREEFVFEGIDTKPVLSINRDFSAPVIVEYDNSDFAFLMKHDKNSFVKYEATQSFALQTLEDMMQGKNINSDFVEAYGYILNMEVELSYKALLLELPSVSTLMQRQKEVDFELIYEVKEKLAKHLASVYKEKLLELYTKNHFPKSKDIDAKSIGQRALKNRCLNLLSELKEEKIIYMAMLQYEESLTMTDRVVALNILENSDVKFSKIAFDNFYAKYKNDTLVMNKYFAIK